MTREAGCDLTAGAEEIEAPAVEEAMGTEEFEVPEEGETATTAVPVDATVAYR